MQKDTAETIALQGLAYIAENESELTAFLEATGVDIKTLRANASSPHILAGVIDFLMMDDKRLLAFCEEAGLPPETPGEARQALPGGDQPHWT
ncbi:DUF3572 domain-containing protein [Tepidicaulis sp.]|jgi:hypothetical protein|uniref:DUF3572 domain-containing protein n=1 Tax=Tepidicaulis sp. TaxID=1920809 RepID=UPI003B59F08C